MSEGVIVGIDLGTTNSEVACLVDGQPRIVEEGGDRGIMPSCVGLDAQGRIVVGAEARNQYAAAPERTVRSIKRRMGSDEVVALGAERYTPTEISAFILKALKERAEGFLDQSVGRAVITVPAYFTDVQRQATREAGRLAGLEVVRIINEPTAAALAYGAQGHEGSWMLVYDLGGGTFDVSVVAVEAGVVEVLASTGDNHLGGDDFDARILERLNAHVAAELGLASPEGDLALQARLLRAAEAAKIQLSSAPFARVEEDHVAQVDGRPRHLSYELSRAAFEADVGEMLERTMASVTAALSDAGVQPRQLDRVLLVGGSTRIPRIAELLRDHVGDEPHGEVDPDLCVALGAAVQAGLEMGQDAGAVLVDVTPYTFGVRAFADRPDGPHPDAFIPLIRRNTRLPARRTDVFYTMHDEQDTAIVEVFQGESPDANDNVRVGSFAFRGLNAKRRAQEEGILVTYSLDLDGILDVHAVERATGRQIRGVVEHALAQEPAALEAARVRLDAAWAAGPGAGRPALRAVDGAVVEEAGAVAVPGMAPEVAQLLERAAKVLAAASEEDREELVNLMEDVRRAVGEGRADGVESAREQLEEILFYVE